MEITKTYEELLSENEELQWKLGEANDVIDAIRNVKIDAIVVNGDQGYCIYSLKTADQTFRLFIEKMNEGAVTLNHEGVIIYSNTRFASIVDMPLQKVIGLTFDGFVAENDLGLYKKTIKSAWTGDCKVELGIKSKTRGHTHCLVSCNAIRMEDGLSLCLIVTDLTSQKETQQHLETQNRQLDEAREKADQMNDQLEITVKERTHDLLISREHFKMLADHIAPMTWTNLPDGSFDYCNQRWHDYTGLSPEECKGSGWKNALHPEDIEHTILKFGAALNSGNTFEAENRYLNKTDGTYRWFLNRAMPLRNENGDIIFWVGTATDIDDQKRELEQKDEFIGVASHELKTPLTSLKGYLQLMAAQSKEELAPVTKNYLDRANNSIRKLQHLVDDLLDVSKINAGRLNYALEPVDLKDIIAVCMENVVQMNKGFEFTVENDLDLLVKGNAERLEQVIMNLVSNAVKYSQDDKRVIVKTSRHENWARVSVIDFGIGLRNEQLKRIFDRFYRVDDKKYMTSGLGMGLYISSQIINTHSGTLGVESEFGKGSTFYFDLQLLS